MVSKWGGHPFYMRRELLMRHKQPHSGRAAQTHTCQQGLSL